MIKQVIHIGVTVTDMDRSIDFYKNTLGLTFEGEMIMEGKETDKLFGREDCKVRVAYLNGSEELYAPPVELLQFLSDDAETDKSDLHKTSISEICFHVDDIEKIYKKLKEKNVEFISKPQYFDFTDQGFGKSKAVYFKDPDGIILELTEPIAGEVIDGEFTEEKTN